MNGNEPSLPRRSSLSGDEPTLGGDRRIRYHVNSLEFGELVEAHFTLEGTKAGINLLYKIADTQGAIAFYADEPDTYIVWKPSQVAFSGMAYTNHIPDHVLTIWHYSSQGQLSELLMPNAKILLEGVHFSNLVIVDVRIGYPDLPYPHLP